MSSTGQGYGEGFFYTPEDQAAQQAIRRRQDYAKALMQGNQHQGRFGGLADAGNSIAGALLAKRADKDATGLASSAQAKMVEALKGIYGGGNGAAASPQVSNMAGSPQEMAGALKGPSLDPEGNPVSSTQPQPPQAPSSFADRIGQSGNAGLMMQFLPQIAQSQMGRENKIWENQQPMSVANQQQIAAQGQQAQQNALFTNQLPMTAAQRASIAQQRAELGEKRSEFAASNPMLMGGQGGAQPLTAYPAATQGMVKAMLEGRQAPPTSFALSKPYWQNMIALANSIDPNFDQTTWGARANARKDFMGGGKSYQTLNAGNTAIQHLGRLNDQIGDVSGVQVPLIGNMINSAMNAGAKESGLPGVPAYNDTLGHLAEETTRFYRGAGGAEADVSRNMGNLSANLSSVQKGAGTANTVHLIYGKLAPMVEQYNKTMGTDFPTSHFLSKDAISTIRRMGYNPDTGEKTEQPQAGNLPQGWKVRQK